jgi:hypothetical protein
MRLRVVASVYGPSPTDALKSTEEVSKPKSPKSCSSGTTAT